MTLPSDPANIQHAVWPIQRDTGLDIATIVDDVIESLKLLDLLIHV